MITKYYNFIMICYEEPLKAKRARIVTNHDNAIMICYNSFSQMMSVPVGPALCARAPS